MKGVLVLAAVSEAATGLALLVVPSLVGQLLLGTIACWPATPLIGMVTYSAAVTLYLAYVGFAGGMNGILLWPAVVVHAILTALLTRASTSDKETRS